MSEQRGWESISYVIDSDVLIATASVHQSTLITRNVRHYPMPDIEAVVPFEIK
jgi:predicted nucleic acid-binding protein